MLYLAAKAALSGLIIAIVSEVARRSPTLGVLIVSLPLVSILGILWLWHDTSDAERIAAHAQSTFWYVLPTLHACDANNAAARNRFLVNACSVLRADLRALSRDNLDVGKIRHHALMQRSKFKIEQAGKFSIRVDHSAAKIS